MSAVTSLLWHVSQAIQKQVASASASFSSPAAGSNNNNNNKPPTLHDIPQLVDQILHSKSATKRATAVKRIYELCDVGHKHNRVPMVCYGGKCNMLLPALAKCLTNQDNNTHDIRHLACLALNNLSIPPENKAVMSLGPASKDIIAGLCQIITEDRPQSSYLGCIVLMNLSFFESSNLLLQQRHHSTPNTENEEKMLDNSPLDNPDSLLRVLEKCLSNNTKSPLAAAPVVSIKLDGSLSSLLGAEKNAEIASSSSSLPPHLEGVRWACGLIKNLAKNEENAALIGQTNIPRCVVENIRQSTSSTAPPPARWTSNSLEDFSLFCILNLAQWPSSSRVALINAGAVKVIQPILSSAGCEGDLLQGLKATMACAFLDAKWAVFPDGGKPAAKCVFELMTNIVENKGQDGQYAHGVFKLSTATMAYRDLARAAVMADHSSSTAKNDESASADDTNTNIKVLAFPLAVALILRIISDVVTLSVIGPKGGDALHDDFMISAEYAVEALEAMLPAVLQEAEEADEAATDAEPPPPHSNTSSSIQTHEKNASGGEISQMLLKYANVSGTSSRAKDAAMQATMKIKQELSGSTSSSLSRPILEISHELWTQYRKRQGQPLSLFTQQ
jgi:hypothetical protein